MHFTGSPSSEIVEKLEHKLLSSYDKSVIPKRTLDVGVNVTLDLALNQIIDVVSKIYNPKVTARGCKIVCYFSRAD